MGRDPRRQSRASIAVGIAATVVVHLLFVFLPSSLFTVETSVPPPAPETIQLELEPPEAVQVADDEPVFTQTNPDAPENKPDATNRVSARDQQAANEKVPEKLSADHAPAREGEDLRTTAIVTGEQSPQPPPETPPSEPSEPSPPVMVSPPQEQEPLPGTVEDKGDNPDGVGTSANEPSDSPKPVDEQTKGTDQPTPAQEPQVARPFSPPGNPRPAPAPRPRVHQVPTTIVQRQVSGVSRLGAVAADAQFSKFGEYQERMIEVIDVRWNTLLASRAYGESGTHVVLAFSITSEGNIKNIEVLDTNAQQLGILLCRTAVEQGQSYGRWSEDMVRAFGDEKLFVVTFYYR